MQYCYLLLQNQTNQESEEDVIQKDYYKHLDEDSKLSVELSLPEIASKVCDLNYGAHRLLSAMVDTLRSKNNDFIARIEAENKQKPENQRLILSEERKRSPLADSIEAALNAGQYY